DFLRWLAKRATLDQPQTVRPAQPNGTEREIAAPVRRNGEGNARRIARKDIHRARRRRLCERGMQIVEEIHMKNRSCVMLHRQLNTGLAAEHRRVQKSPRDAERMCRWQ